MTKQKSRFSLCFYILLIWFWQCDIFSCSFYYRYRFRDLEILNLRIYVKKKCVQNIKTSHLHPLLSWSERSEETLCWVTCNIMCREVRDLRKSYVESHATSGVVKWEIWGNLSWVTCNITCRVAFLFSELRDDCSLCWYWWNCWPSLFKLSFLKFDYNTQVQLCCKYTV